TGSVGDTDRRTGRAGWTGRGSKGCRRGTMQIVVESRDGLAQQVEMRNKRIVADEPVEVGGTNLGPTPYELLLGALGSCTAMTVIMYARRKGWPLESVRVELSYDRVHARDCENCEEEDAYLEQFTKVVTVRGPLDEEQRA